MTMLAALPMLAQATGSPPAGGSSNTLLIWAIALIGVAIALFIIELFIPSGGLIGFLSAAALVGGIVCLFGVDTTLGLVSTLAVLIALPFVIGLAIAIWPNTWVVQLMMLKNAERPGAATPSPAAGVRVGQRGRAVTDLRPVGTVVLEGQRTECLGLGGMIEAGSDVEVVAVDGAQVKVRRV